MIMNYEADAVNHFFQDDEVEASCTSKRTPEELFITERYKELLEAKSEVRIPVGIVDLVSEKFNAVVEVKAVKHWKHAIGQVLVYKQYFKDMDPFIILFGDADDSYRCLIEQQSSIVGVRVIFVNGLSEDEKYKARNKIEFNMTHGGKVKDQVVGNVLFQDSLESIAKDKELTLEPKNILLYLYSKLEFENFIQQSQTDIAEALGMQRGNVSRAMKILISKKIILEDKKNGRLKYYRLNPDYGWKGKVKHLQNLRRDQLKVIKGGKADNE